MRDTSGLPASSSEADAADALRGLLIPGTPLLLRGVDPGEPEAMTAFRSAVHTALRRAPVWTVLLPPHEPPSSAGGSASAGTGSAAAEEPLLPGVLSLGGLGVPRGVVVPSVPGAAAELSPADVRGGEELASAVASLRRQAPDSAQRSARVHIGFTVAALCALEAGVSVRLQRASAPPSVPLLVPLDFSGAADPDAPLAPREGAAAFDAALEEALTGAVDREALACLDAGPAAAWTDGVVAALGASGDPSRLRGTVRAATDCHRVRYRLIGLEVSRARPASPLPPASGEDRVAATGAAR